MQPKFLESTWGKGVKSFENLPKKNKIRLLKSQSELNGSLMKVWSTGFASHSQFTLLIVTRGWQTPSLLQRKGPTNSGWLGSPLAWVTTAHVCHSPKEIFRGVRRGNIGQLSENRFHKLCPKDHMWSLSKENLD